MPRFVMAAPISSSSSQPPSAGPIDSRATRRLIMGKKSSVTRNLAVMPPPIQRWTGVASGDGAEIEAGLYLFALCRHLQMTSLDRRGIDCRVDARDTGRFPASVCRMLGLVVSELVKDASAGSPKMITVTLRRRGTTCLCTVACQGLNESCAAATAALAALAALAAMTAATGGVLGLGVDIRWLQLTIGIFLLLFGMRWLAKAVARGAGLKALHDEAQEFASTRAQLARGDWTASWLIAFKGVLLEGLEVWLVVVALSLHGRAWISSTAGALAALLVVIAAGLVIRAPLRRVPHNAINFVVRVMITAFGTFWTIQAVVLAAACPLYVWN